MMNRPQRRCSLSQFIRIQLLLHRQFATKRVFERLHERLGRVRIGEEQALLLDGLRLLACLLSRL